MFDLAVLKKIRSYYLKEKPDGSGYDYEDYKRQCQEFAARLKLPKHLWSLVHVPAFISLDNASIHDWARRLCFAPRQPDDVLEKHMLQRYHMWSGLVPPSTYDFGLSADKTPPAVDLIARHMTARGLVQAPARTKEQQDDISNANIMRNTIREHDQANECRWVQDQLHALSLELPGMICLVPQQVMPLPKVTPDLHCPIEHMVGTVKAYVRAKIFDFDVPDAELQMARTYQRWINEAVQEKGNGAAGRRHVTRSVDKQKCIAQILSTPADREVVVKYVFGGRNADGERGARVTEHRVRGTGGAWITDSKWT